MPFSARLGRSIVFTAVFYDPAEVVTVPSSATMTVTYPLSSNSLTTVSCAIDMAAAGNFFTATWASSVAALGLSSFSITAPGQVPTAPGATGTLRLIS
jgi:hypothetical protein